jgi:hypothetical protein
MDGYCCFVGLSGRSRVASQTARSSQKLTLSRRFLDNCVPGAWVRGQVSEIGGQADHGLRQRPIVRMLAGFNRKQGRTRPARSHRYTLSPPLNAIHLLPRKSSMSSQADLALSHEAWIWIMTGCPSNAGRFANSAVCARTSVRKVCR